MDNSNTKRLEAAQQKLQSRKECLVQQQHYTNEMVTKLQTLDHIPLHLHPLYAIYRNTLLQGHAFAYRFQLDGETFD